MALVVDVAGSESSSALGEARAVSRFLGKRVHFIGIGGSGMSGLARMLMDGGAVVSGSEPKPNGVSLELGKRGAKVAREQDGRLLDGEMDLVVRTAAVPDTNAEYQRAVGLGIKTIKYAEMLGMVMAERLGVAVAGTHGKSTTSAMVSYALMKLGADPSFVIGGTVPQLGGGSRSGGGKAFVAEACEYDRSFHSLRPTVAIITNVEADHLDCYKDLDDIVGSFRHFGGLVPAGGKIITLATDKDAVRSVAGLTAEIELCQLVEDGESPVAGAAWYTRVTGMKNGCHTGDIYYHAEHVGSLEMSVPGRHNLINATMAVAACAACGQDPQAAAEAVGQFTGVDRRMTYMGTCNGATVIDDYGHHPTEVLATLRALRERYSPKRLICVFQPHQASRTRLLLEEFGKAFADADEVIMPEIYFVRDSEADRKAVKAQDLVDRVIANGVKAWHEADFSRIVGYLKAEARDGDLIVTLGAGTVWEIARDVAA